MEALGRDLILVVPTGGGKTLVAAMLMARIRALNPQRMGLFVVDRVPLVFQQAAAISKETGMDVLPLCGETRTQSATKALRAGRYQALVVTAGALVEMLAAEELSLSHFAVVVFDEAHHATGRSPYSSLIQKLAAEPATSRPRILGLTASPFVARTPAEAAAGAKGLRETFCGAVFFKPPLPPTAAGAVEWLVVTPSQGQLFGLRCLVKALQRGLRELSLDNSLTSASFAATAVLSDALEVLNNAGDRLLQDPCRVTGRIRGALRGAEENLQPLDPEAEARRHLRLLRSAAAAIDLCMVMGPGDALALLIEELTACETAAGTRSKGEAPGAPEWFKEATSCWPDLPGSAKQSPQVWQGDPFLFHQLLN